MSTAARAAPRTLTSDINVMERETAMAMATIASLTDEEMRAPSRCEGWTRAHVIAHLARDADAWADLVLRAVDGGQMPTPESPETRDAGLDTAAPRSAAELTAAFVAADRRLLDAVRRLRGGVQAETVSLPVVGEISVFSLPARRTTEMIVHHDDLRTTWEWHEADPDGIVDAIGVCVHRLHANPDSPGLQVVAREGEEWTVGDGSFRIEGYYEELLPFLARERVEEGLRYEGALPRLPAW